MWLDLNHMHSTQAVFFKQRLHLPSLKSCFSHHIIDFSAALSFLDEKFNQCFQFPYGHL